MKKTVMIIGAGLAGCEAAWYLANQGIKVILFEKKSIEKNEIQKLDYFAELVCSNSLRSTDLKNAVGTLKEEMKLFNSLVLQAAEFAQIPAGGSLAVDRQNFSRYITEKIQNHSNILIKEEEMDKIDIAQLILIATGPLTSKKFQQEIINLVGEDYFYFFDAIAPIVELNSLNTNVTFRKNRYEKGETKDYINCPMNKEEYTIFYDQLINAQLAPTHLESEKNLKYFEGCMPIEAMAKRGFDTLRFGPLKPAGLSNIDGTSNFAVVQLRQDNVQNNLYNMVGFQTNLIWSEQKRVFRLIPGLENAEFLRYGVMHQNNFINSPTLLNSFNQLKSNQNIFFAGQITGVEGYVESASSGLIAAVNIERMLNSKNLLEFPSSTVMGGLQNYITSTDTSNFQPMKANWSIVENLEIKYKIKKVDKKQLYSNRALESMKKFINENF